MSDYGCRRGCANCLYGEVPAVKDLGNPASLAVSYEQTPSVAIFGGWTLIEFTFQEGYGTAAWREWLVRETNRILAPLGITSPNPRISFACGRGRDQLGSLFADRPPWQMLEVKVGNWTWMPPRVLGQWSGVGSADCGIMDTPTVWVRQYTEPGTFRDRTYRVAAHEVMHWLNDWKGNNYPSHDEKDPNSLMYPQTIQRDTDPGLSQTRVWLATTGLDRFTERWVPQ